MFDIVQYAGQFGAQKPDKNLPKWGTVAPWAVEMRARHGFDMVQALGRQYANKQGLCVWSKQCQDCGYVLQVSANYTKGKVVSFLVYLHGKINDIVLLSDWHNYVVQHNAKYPFLAMVDKGTDTRVC